MLQLYCIKNRIFGRFSVAPFSTFALKAVRSYSSTTSGASWWHPVSMRWSGERRRLVMCCQAETEILLEWFPSYLGKEILWLEFDWNFKILTSGDPNGQTTGTPVQALIRTQLPSLYGCSIRGPGWVMDSGPGAFLRKSFAFSRLSCHQWSHCPASSPSV